MNVITFSTSNEGSKVPSSISIDQKCHLVDTWYYIEMSFFCSFNSVLCFQAYGKTTEN